MLADLANAALELAAGLIMGLSVRQLWRTHTLSGVHPEAMSFFLAFGIWNLFFYPGTGHTLSYWAGGCAMVMNGAWVSLQLWLLWRQREMIEATKVVTFLTCFGGLLSTLATAWGKGLVTLDMVNAVFQFGTAWFIGLSALALWRSRQLSGISPAQLLFFSAWGYWNLYFFWSLHLPLSLAGAAVAALSYSAWLTAYVRASGWRVPDLMRAA